MSVGLYMDVHAPQAVVEQLRRRQVEVITAVEDGARTWPDDALLERAREMGRLVFTQDIRFKALAEQWQAKGRPFAGLVFAHQLHATIGELVHDLELIAQATDPADWENQIVHLPL